LVLDHSYDRASNPSNIYYRRVNCSCQLHRVKSIGSKENPRVLPQVFYHKHRAAIDRSVFCAACSVSGYVFSATCVTQIWLRVFPYGDPCARTLSCSVWTQVTVPTGKSSERPRGMPLVTRLLASSDQAWEPMASSSVKWFVWKRALCLQGSGKPPLPHHRRARWVGTSSQTQAGPGLHRFDGIYSVNW
jgi:hypothetical protein